MNELKTERERLPRWMKSPLPKGENYMKVKRLIADHHLNTICTSGNCPNKGECWSAGTASFMILGDKCTRNCRFCFVQNDVPDPVDWMEPLRLAKTIRTLQLKHCVITSVTRDDLADGGAEFWATTIRKIKELNPETTIETLIPDFNANAELIQKVIDAAPDVISHNMETVRRLTPKVRSTARYDRSLKTISIISEAGIVSKSGIMVGLGETIEEMLQAMDDLRSAGCKVLTIGQYLQPDSNLLPVQEYIEPDIFEKYREEGLKRGFSYVESRPLVRSSYHAERHVNG
ncbi:MAG: lipoyl synthase [Bacteroidota bacterium]|nr:lipoyl synthase [Bacteroidota bacterium]MDO9614524.1 lipoyl synthase [Bacteroidota bacterium]